MAPYSQVEAAQQSSAADNGNYRAHPSVAKQKNALETAFVASAGRAGVLIA